MCEDVIKLNLPNTYDIYLRYTKNDDFDFDVSYLPPTFIDRCGDIIRISVLGISDDEVMDFIPKFFSYFTPKDSFKFVQNEMIDFIENTVDSDEYVYMDNFTYDNKQITFKIQRHTMYLIKSKELSVKDDRYVVVDEEGNILDDCQGHGYLIDFTVSVDELLKMCKEKHTT